MEKRPAGRKNDRIAIIVGIAASVILVGAFGSVYVANPLRGVLTNPQTNSGGGAYEGLWIGYPYLGKLASDAKAIVVGKVSDVSGTHIDKTAKIPLTDFTVSIEEPIKGVLQRGDNITVEQLGSVQSTNATSDEDTLMKVGERYVLFLDNAPTSKIYYSLGGPQGRYLLENNLVYDMNIVSHGKYSFIQVKADGKPLNDFTNEILAAVANPDATKPVIEQDKPGHYETPLNGTTSDAGNQTVAGGAPQ